MKTSILTDLGAIPADVDRNVNLAPNFKLYELANNAGDPKYDMYVFSPESNKHVEALQDFRDIIGKPVVVNSGYRQYGYNKKIGGDINSAHLIGCATDIQLIKGLKDVDYINAWFAALQAAGINQGAINVNAEYYHLESFTQDRYGYSNPYTIRVYTDTDYNRFAKIYKYNSYYIMKV